MIKIQYKWLLAPTFLEVMRKIAGHTGFPTIKDSYNASKIVEHFESERKTAAMMRDKLLVKFQPKGASNGQENEEAKGEEISRQEDWQKAIEELLAHEVTFEKRDPIKVAHLEGLKLSPVELLSLNSVVDFSGMMDTAPEAATSSEVAASPSL